jgi:hypothetical protein
MLNFLGASIKKSLQKFKQFFPDMQILRRNVYCDYYAILKQRQLSLVLNKHQAIKMYGLVEVQHHYFLTLTLDKANRLHTPAVYPHGKGPLIPTAQEAWWGQSQSGC